MRLIKSAIFYSLVAIISFLFGFGLTAGAAYLLTESPKTYSVKAEFESVYAASCAIVPYDINGFDGGGTGVVLKNGLILTAKHVVDANNDGILGIEERVVDIKFYYPKQYTIKGVVVYMPSGVTRPGRGVDFALVQPEQPVFSNIELVSINYFKKIGVGEEVFTVGRTMTDELNIAVGYLAPPIEELVCDRITMSGWDGNSGGGIFVKNDGKLIGVFVITRKHPYMGFPIPNWIGYQSAESIRSHLVKNKMEYLLDVQKPPVKYYYLLFLLIPLTIIPYVILR